jgi:alkylation response protein AidB-like acyl-CoA dehydrogenase
MGASVPTGVPDHHLTRHSIAADFERACRRADGWPRPGSGRTGRRLALLASSARRDLVLGRLIEAHADAVAIVHELGCSEWHGGQRWGVWAAGPARSTTAKRCSGGWVLDGTKAWCSGVSMVTHALVDASTVDGQRLFAVSMGTPGIDIQPDQWTGAGMQRSDTRSVRFSRAAAQAVGGPGEYLSRPGFWMGSVGVAACWHGGSLAVAGPLYRKAREAEGEPLTLAHLGAVHAALSRSAASLWWAAQRMDRDPAGDHAVTALAVRDTVERTATEIVDRVGRALGPAPLAHDRRHAATVADLLVYVRQNHGEHDRAEIGRRVTQGGI